MSFASSLQVKMLPSYAARDTEDPAEASAAAEAPSGMSLAEFNQAWETWEKAPASVPVEVSDGEGTHWEMVKPNPSEFDFSQGRERALYAGVANGQVGLKKDEFDNLFSDGDGLLSRWEFERLPADVQGQARAHPQRYMQSVLAQRNVANGDLGSTGAEGGFSDYSTARWDDERGMVPDPSKYMVPDDSGGWGGWASVLGTVLQFTPLAPLGTMLQMAGAAEQGDPLGMIAAVAGAAGVTGAASNAVSSGLDVGKTAADAIVSGGMGAGMTLARGAGFGDALRSGATSAAGSAVGNTVTDMTGSPSAGWGASTVTRGLINSTVRNDDEEATPGVPGVPVLPRKKIAAQNLNLGWMTR